MAWHPENSTGQGSGIISWRTFWLASFWFVLFIATHLPRVPKVIGKVSDKTWHFAAFATLSYLLSWALSARGGSTLRHIMVVLTTVALYAAVDELLQIPVGRTCDVWDWVADMIGAVLGVVVFHGLRLLKGRYYRPVGGDRL